MNGTSEIIYLMKYAIIRIAAGQNAEGWRKAFHRLTQVLGMVISGDIAHEHLAELRKVLDKIGANGKMDGRADASPQGDWVTINGTHVLLGEGGVAQSGGKLKGMTFANAKSQKKSTEKSGGLGGNSGGGSGSGSKPRNNPKLNAEQNDYVNQIREKISKCSPEEMQARFSAMGGEWAQKAKQAFENGTSDQLVEEYLGTWESYFEKGGAVPQKTKSNSGMRNGFDADRGQKSNYRQMMYDGDFDAQTMVIARDCHISQSQADKLHRALDQYIDSGSYEFILAAARSRTAKEAGLLQADYQEGKAIERDIETYIRLAPKWSGGTLNRITTPIRDLAQQIIDDAKAGKQIDQGSFSSWSSKEIKAKATNNADRQTIVYVTPGTKQGTAVAHLAKYDNHEVLISGNARRKASSVYEENGVTYIECNEI